MSRGNESTLPQALPLVFTHQAKWYSPIHQDIGCILDNDSFTEMLNEDYDSFVLNPWSWNKNDMHDDSVKLLIVPIAIATILTNVIVIATFFKERMMSALTVILIAMAVSDTLTVLIPSTAIVYMYANGVWPDYIPFTDCRIWGYLTKYIPTITHNASVWLTVFLALDRCLAVRRPFLMRRVCMPRRSVLIIVCVYVTAILVHFCRFVDTNYIPVKIISTEMFQNNLTHLIETNSTYSMRNENSSAVLKQLYTEVCKASIGKQTCKAVYSEVFENFPMYEFYYYWLVIIFVKFVPCTVLIILDTLMLTSLRRAEKLRHAISNGNLNSCTTTKSSSDKYYESRRMTRIIIVVIVIVIIVELPIGVILILWTLAKVHGTHFLSESDLNVLSRVANFIVYISYPIIFLLYCCISSRFRSAFCQWFCCKRYIEPGEQHGNKKPNFSRSSSGKEDETNEMIPMVSL